VLSTAFAHVAVGQPFDSKKALDKNTWDEPAITGSSDPATGSRLSTKLSAVRVGSAAEHFNHRVGKARLEQAVETMLKS
jgi:hypothetical protein